MKGWYRMITFMICLVLLSVLFWVGFTVTGALLKACLWLFILLPIGVVLCVMGAVLCCTLILIPLGAKVFMAGIHVILPG